ncbi:MAG: universal stress protein, partial [Pseudoxanthomonas sp.]|nr:universal stress protein [Pseudoxanthomonas sp.]
WSAGYENTPQYLEDRRKQAMEILEPAAAAAAAAGVKANVMHVVDRYAADGIIDTIASQNSDLVVLASHGRRGIRRALLGSQTAEVLARATVPVLVIR